MPKVSKASASQVEAMEGVLEDRSEELDGYTVGLGRRVQPSGRFGEETEVVMKNLAASGQA
jgi:hypothetical protein